MAEQVVKVRGAESRLGADDLGAVPPRSCIGNLGLMVSQTSPNWDISTIGQCY